MKQATQPPIPRKLNIFERVLIWLSSADSEVLQDKCPKWERLKYEAFGASVLVPVLFGMIAASYAVSTLTQNVYIIVGFALVWGFIIMTVDRLLLATYRAHVPLSKKATQFVLRVSVAILMGLTVSHPLTLLLFKDTINSEIEKKRSKEMAIVRAEADVEKKALEERITQATLNLQQQQQRYQDTIGGGFLENKNRVPADVAAKPAEPAKDEFADIDRQIDEYKRERDRVRGELDRWQREYDEEISGARTGTPGIGPEARKIEAEELVWRREELRRLTGVLTGLTKQRTDISANILARNAEANAEIEERRKTLEKQKLDMFTQQQGALIEVIRGQIDSASAELDRLRDDAKELSENTRERIDALKGEKRADLMTQTLVLHHLFEDPEGGGHFALAVYIVLIGLFTLVDTIPLVVKFFSVPGTYDYHQQMFEASKNLQAPGRGDIVFDEKFQRSMLEKADIRHNILSYEPGVARGSIDQTKKNLPLHESLEEREITEAVERGETIEEAEKKKAKKKFFGSKKKVNGHTHSEASEGTQSVPQESPVANRQGVLSDEPKNTAAGGSVGSHINGESKTMKQGAPAAPETPPAPPTPVTPEEVKSEKPGKSSANPSDLPAKRSPEKQWTRMEDKAPPIHDIAESLDLKVKKAAKGAVGLTMPSKTQKKAANGHSVKVPQQPSAVAAPGNRGPRGNLGILGSRKSSSVTPAARPEEKTPATPPPPPAPPAEAPRTLHDFVDQPDPHKGFGQMIQKQQSHEKASVSRDRARESMASPGGISLKPTKK